MIEISNGKFSVRLRAESDKELEFLKSLNTPDPIGYMMFNKEFLITRKKLPQIMEKYKQNDLLQAKVEKVVDY